MIFVVLAMGSFTCSFQPASIRQESISMSAAPPAATSGVSAAACAFPFGSAPSRSSASSPAANRFIAPAPRFPSFSRCFE